MVVIGGNKDAFGVAVVENCDGLGGGQVCRVRVSYRARQDALRVAHPRANEIEVVNAVIEDLKTRRRGEKGPEMPRRVGACLNFDVVDFSEETTVRERRDGEVVGRVAEREVHGGDESFIPAKVADDEGLSGESRPWASA